MPTLQEDSGQVVPAGTLIFDRGERVEHLFFLAEGQVRLSRLHGAAELCLDVVEEGDFFGEAFLFAGECSDHCAWAVRECRLLRIEGHRIEELMAGQGELGQALVRHLARRLQDSQRARLDLLSLPEGQRILRVLRTWQCAGQTRDDGRVCLEAAGIPARLASAAGVPMERARQVLRCLEEQEILRRSDDGNWTLAHGDALEDYGEYWSLKDRFDPLDEAKLMGLSGLAAPELRTLSERLLRRRLGSRDGERLHTPLLRYYELKSRFEFGCSIPEAMGD